MSYANFRYCDPIVRARMAMHNRDALKKLEDAEIKFSGSIWFRPRDFPGTCEGLETERPGKDGQIFRFG